MTDTNASNRCTERPRVALVLGLTGGYGRSIATELLRRGWQIRALVRDRRRVAEVTSRLSGSVTLFEGDVLDREALHSAARGACVIVHGVNAPYPQWNPLVIQYAQAVAEVAVTVRATILFPGNVYAFAPGEALDEETPEAPPTRKGALRVEAEAILRDATQRGARLIILRGGDFFGVGAASSWMTFLLGKTAKGGAITWPAPPSKRHQWAFLPDFAHSHVELLEAGGLPASSTFHFEGHIATGAHTIATLRALLGDPARRVRRLPWFVLRCLGLFAPMMRELARMRYLWDQEVLMSGHKLRVHLGAVRHTPLVQALASELAALGDASAQGPQEK